MMEIKCYKSTLVALHFFFNLGADLPRAGFLGADLPRAYLAKGRIVQFPNRPCNRVTMIKISYNPFIHRHLE